MEIKKNARAKLENYSKLFLQLGLALALLVIYLILNIKSYDDKYGGLDDSFFIQEEVLEEIPVTKRIEEVKPPPPPPPAPEIIEIVKDESLVEEVILETTETDETEYVEVKIDDIIEVIEDEEVTADIPFTKIEEVPVFPGCKGTKEQKKDCFNKKMDSHIKKNFNSELAKDLGLTPGIKKIFIQFTIDKNGYIVNIKARAPHKSLEKEAKRVIALLPKIQPGRQRNRNVRVSYLQPIIFKVIE